MDETSQNLGGEESKENFFGPKFWYSLLVILLLVAAGVGYWYKVLRPTQELNTEVPIVQDETANWQTYRNEEYGFELKYPNDWEEVEWGLLTLDKEFVVKPDRNPEGDIEGFCKIVIHDKFSVQDFISDVETDAASFDQKIVLTTKPIKIGNMEGVEVVPYTYPHDLSYFFPLKGGSTLSINLVCGDDVVKQGKEIVNQILSTFKFTDQIDTSTWKIYRNEEYGFELKYPPEYNFCLNEFCYNDIADIQYVKIWGGTDGNEISFSLEIAPSKNNLGMSAVEFGKNTQEVNRKYGDYVEDTGKINLFRGMTSYEFIVKNGFQEEGYLLSSKGIERGEGYSGHVIKNPHRIIYFDKNDVLYRIKLPTSDGVLNQILSTFKFTK